MVADMSYETASSVIDSWESVRRIELLVFNSSSSKFVETEATHHLFFILIFFF